VAAAAAAFFTQSLHAQPMHPPDYRPVTFLTQVNALLASAALSHLSAAEISR